MRADLPVMFLILGWKLSDFHNWVWCWLWIFHGFPLSSWESSLVCWVFLKIIIIKARWILPNAFFLYLLSWDGHGGLFLNSIKMIYYFDKKLVNDLVWRYATTFSLADSSLKWVSKRPLNKLKHTFFSSSIRISNMWKDFSLSNYIYIKGILKLTFIFYLRLLFIWTFQIFKVIENLLSIFLLNIEEVM